VAPPDEAVDRIAQRRLAERELVDLPLPFVAPVAQSIGPRDERLATPAIGVLVDRVAVDHVAVADRVAAQRRADLDDDHPLVAMAQLELLARRRRAQRS